MYPANSGADFLCEGSVPGGWGDVLEHVGPGNDWNWNPILSFSEVFQFSDIKSVDANKAIEFSIKRSALGTMSNFVNFAIIESNEGWTEIGTLPVSQTPESKFTQIEL